MNLTKEMAPGIMLLLMGAALALFGDKVVVRSRNAQGARLLGLFLAFAGALMVFTA